MGIGFSILFLSLFGICLRGLSGMSLEDVVFMRERRVWMVGLGPFLGDRITMVLEGNSSKRANGFSLEQRMQSRVKVDEMQLGPRPRYGRYARDGIPGTITTCRVGVRRFLFQVNRSSGVATLAVEIKRGGKRFLCEWYVMHWSWIQEWHRGVISRPACLWIVPSSRPTLLINRQAAAGVFGECCIGAGDVALHQMSGQKVRSNPSSRLLAMFVCFLSDSCRAGGKPRHGGNRGV
ncbi:uncharacterized protein CLUP02_16355 [Colletotrichum lupini]|uniref:Secreted protein n=1 Tax=Colletotrichum lupini TaxID=145971 RepID=A0A9Q8T7T8_9PEZI|nr:uncharacterized protein CLUP02_16355 [Colletotrichum lupini]UQC90823.1 hypothetical protein CLUP02_16355 [Colletotrichum lupini]